MTIPRHNGPVSIATARPVKHVIAAREQLVRIVLDGETHHLTVAAARELNRQIMEAIMEDTQPQRVIKAVCAAFDVSANDVMGRQRLQRILDSRFAACYLLREVLRLSLHEAGDALHKDHTWITWGTRRCADLMKTDAKYRACMEPLIAQFK